MKRLIIIILLMHLILLGKWTVALGAKNIGLVADSTPDKVTLRWVVTKWEPIGGYNLYRKTPVTNWRKINQSLITRLDSLKEIKSILGVKSSLYEEMFELNSQGTAIDPLSIDKLLTDEKQWPSVNLLTILYSDVAKVLGLVYEDKSIKPGEIYSYRLTQISRNGIEEDVASINNVIGGEETLLPVPVGFSAEAKDALVDFIWDYKTEFNKKHYIVTYNLYRSTNEKGPFESVNQTPVLVVKFKGADGKFKFPDAFYTDRSVKNGTKYWYQVVAVNIAGRESKRSKAIMVMPKDTTPPSVPAKFVGILFESKIQLEWAPNDEPDLAGYYIYRSDEDVGPYKKIDSLISPIQKRYTDGGLIGGKVYWYKISAVDLSKNESKKSGPIPILIKDTIPPEPPKGLIAEVDEKGVYLKWDKNTEPDVLGYYLRRSGGIHEKIFGVIHNGLLETNNYTDILPKASQVTFFYQLIAVDTSFNESNPSSSVKARLPDHTPPSVPYISSVSAGNCQIKIKWVPIIDEDLKGFYVYRKNSKKGKLVKINKDIVLKDVVIYTDKGLMAENKYWYAVSSIDESGNESGMSSIRLARCYDKIPPKTPEGLKAILTKKKASLSWDRNPEPDIKGYTIYRSFKEKGDYVIIHEYLPENKFIDKDFKVGKEYWYKIKAVDFSYNMSPLTEAVKLSSIDKKGKQ